MFIHSFSQTVESLLAVLTGDLHPGNVLVSNDFKFILLDVGIVTTHSEADHRLISDILAAFIRCDGRKAGRLMIGKLNGSFFDSNFHSLH
jgi:predicted unusual protein kinase regulating ubiquinone biosynthesis (AarF/ABC1/UbiB family)